jgi:hypothetical protein
MTTMMRWIGGCGWGSLGRTAVAADVVGTWHYKSDGPTQLITIVINADGTYRQSIFALAGPTTLPAVQNQNGLWELKNDRYQTIYAHGVLMKGVDGNWLAEDGTGWWRVGKSKLRAGEAAIFGGEFADPDGWQEFEKER